MKGEIMKVTIIPPTSRTGESVYSKYLISGLIRRGIDVEILRNSFLSRPNIKIFLGSFLLENLIKDRGISIVHNLDNLGPYLIRQRSAGVKNVLTVHDIAPVILPQIHNWIIKFDFKLILPKLIENCNSLIVDSHSTKEDLVSNFGVNDNKIDVIPLGVDTSFFYPRTPEETETIFKKYGIPTRYILYTGDDNARKNLKNLIIAYGRISSEIPHSLVLVGPINKSKVREIIDGCPGSGNFKKQLLSRVITSGYVDYEDLPTIYSGASAFVFPSLYEGFGLPVLEAMACGTPVITSNTSSLPEVVGDAGIYINPLHPKEIAVNILKVLEDNALQEKLKKIGFERARKFTWEETVEKTIQVYKKIG